MMEFIRHNQKLVSFISLVMIGISLLADVLYFIFFPIQAQGDPKSFVETPLTHQPDAISTPVVAGPSASSIIMLLIMLAIVILIVVVFLAYLKYLAIRRKQRDKQRKDDLKRLAQAFESYKLIHGQYPLSSTFRAEYYTAVNLSNDWNYYGLPNKDHMTRFLPEWPISDPSIDYMSKHQVNQYLYYPKENGQKFFLYAHLESPTKNEMIDYNVQDNLLRSWGNYNYRIASGEEQPLPVSDDHSTAGHPVPQAASPELPENAEPAPDQLVAATPVTPVTPATAAFHPGSINQIQYEPAGTPAPTDPSLDPNTATIQLAAETTPNPPIQYASIDIPSTSTEATATPNPTDDAPDRNI